MNNKYSVNPKLNKVLCGIENQILGMYVNNYIELIQELHRYMTSYKNEPDYSVAQHGNLLCYYDDIKDFYRRCGYKSTARMSNNKIWELYKRQVGYVARRIVRGAHDTDLC